MFESFFSGFEILLTCFKYSPEVKNYLKYSGLVAGIGTALTILMKSSVAVLSSPKY